MLAQWNQFTDSRNKKWSERERERERERETINRKEAERETSPATTDASIAVPIGGWNITSQLSVPRFKYGHIHDVKWPIRVSSSVLSLSECPRPSFNKIINIYIYIYICVCVCVCVCVFNFSGWWKDQGRTFAGLYYFNVLCFFCSVFFFQFCCCCRFWLSVSVASGRGHNVADLLEASRTCLLNRLNLTVSFCSLWHRRMEAATCKTDHLTPGRRQ